MITIITSNSSPEPEQPKSWEATVKEYRTNHKRALTRVDNAISEPIMQATRVFKAALVK